MQLPLLFQDLRDLVGDELAQVGRPVTFDVTRVSRDPTSWVALGTYGLASLDETLERIIENDAEADDEALVIAEDGEVVSAFRADRTPPEPVRELTDLLELGAASSIGDAEASAAAAAATEAKARRDRVARVLTATVASWEDDLRRRLADLVRETVRSECASSVRSGDPVGPLLAWQELKRDEMSGFAFVEQFAGRLGVDLNRAVSTDVDGAAVTLSRQAAGERLYGLIEEWKVRVGSQ